MQNPEQYPESVARLISATDYLSNIGQAIGHLPNPTFSTMFIEQPHVMAPMLKQLCLTRDPRRYSLLISWPYPSARYYHALALVGAGFTVAVLEMLTDDKWYMELKEAAQEGTMTPSKVSVLFVTTAFHIHIKLLKQLSFHFSLLLCTRSSS